MPQLGVGIHRAVATHDLQLRRNEKISPLNIVAGGIPDTVRGLSRVHVPNKTLRLERQALVLEHEIKACGAEIHYALIEQSSVPQRRNGRAISPAAACTHGTSLATAFVRIT